MPRSRSRSPRHRRSNLSAFTTESKSCRRINTESYPKRHEYRTTQGNHRRSDVRRCFENGYDNRDRRTQDNRLCEGYRNRRYNKINRREQPKSWNSDECSALDRLASNGFTFDDPAIVPKGAFYEHDRRENFTGSGGSHSFFKTQDRVDNRSSTNRLRSNGYLDNDHHNSKHIKSEYVGYRTDPLEERRFHGSDQRRRSRRYRHYEGHISQKRPSSPIVWKHDKFEHLEKETRRPPKLESVSD